ncbi:MAG TPA: peptide chain release factor N(5)-glutamine methyltransferase [Nitriliruptorales bacterium]
MRHSSVWPDHLSSVLATHRQRLADAGIDTPDVDVSLLAAHVLGVPARRLPAALPEADDDALARLDALVERRASRVPVQHLVGVAPFRHLELVVRPGVFVPRPETEVLVGVALELLRTRPGTRTVLEPCTGTGAIALALASEEPDLHVVATDVDPAAVSLACRNLARVRSGDAGVDGLQAGSTVEVLEGELLSPVSHDLRGAIDLLVSNPPYLPIGDRDAMPPEVAEHDPSVALFGGEDGFEVLDRLLAEARAWLVPGGAVVIEIDDRRGADAAARASAAGLRGARVLRDLTGRDRVLVAAAPGGGA